MAKFLFVVLTNAVAGEDEAFNEWYTHRHLADVLKLEGYTAAQRFRFVERTGAASAPQHKYMALYEVETDDLDALHSKLAAVAGTAEMPWNESFDRSNVVGWYFQPITDKKTAPNRKSSM